MSNSKEVVLKNPSKMFNLKEVLDMIQHKEKKSIDSFSEINEVLERIDIDKFDLDSVKFSECNRLTYTLLYSNLHHSDEASCVKFIYLDGKPVSFITYIGDRRIHDSFFIGKDTSTTVKEYIKSFLTHEEDDNTLSYVELDEPITFGDHYTIFVAGTNSTETFSHIQQPRNSYCFSPNMDNLYYIKDESTKDEMTIVPAKFISYITDISLYNEKEEDKYMWISIDGVKTKAHFDSVLIKNVK